MWLCLPHCATCRPAPYDMSAAPRAVLAAPHDVSAAPRNMLATQDTHGNSMGLEGPFWGRGDRVGTIYKKFYGLELLKNHF